MASAARVILLLSLISITYAARSRSSFQKFQVRSHLKRLNKPAIKSIQSPDGDIIDCVHISHQPAFDHPFLANHSIQMKPSFHPEGSFSDGLSNIGADPIPQLWRKNGECPHQTIPIRRTKKSDIHRASSVKRFGKKIRRTIYHPGNADMLNSVNGHQHAISFVDGGGYYGAKAVINVWRPQIYMSNEFSLSQIWILGGSFDFDLNSIEAGWQVSPDLYGDNNTRLFTYWTSDAYQATGCYNLLCSGFIQLNNQIAMGASISPLSSYGGSQFDISILIWKDLNGAGNWWMQLGENNVLGYWPAPLFSNLGEVASMIEWGGEVVNTKADGMHTTTEMGSGHFPEDGFTKASYFRNIQVVDKHNKLQTPKKMGTFTEDSNCYDVKPGGDAAGWGMNFYYGGPGRNPRCP